MERTSVDAEGCDGGPEAPGAAGAGSVHPGGCRPAPLLPRMADKNRSARRIGMARQLIHLLLAHHHDGVKIAYDIKDVVKAARAWMEVTSPGRGD